MKVKELISYLNNFDSETEVTCKCMPTFKVDDISYKMWTNQVYQKWVDDMWNYLEKYKPGFTEKDVLELLKEAQASLKEEFDNNIQTYFYPETL